MNSPFTPGFTTAVRVSVAEALGRQGMAPIPVVEPVTATVLEMDAARLAVLLRDGPPLTRYEWAFVEGEG